MRFYINPDPKKWATVDRYAVLTRRNVLAGMKPAKAAREAAIAVGYKERPTPMTDEVRETLRERNEQKRDLRASMKHRAKAKSRKPRRERREKRA